MNGEEGEEKKGEKRINHENWRDFKSVKNTLINYRIMVQPMIILGTILPWLRMIKDEVLWVGFNNLLTDSNNYMTSFLSG